MFRVPQLEGTLSALPDGQAKQSGRIFLKELEECRAALKSTHEKISGMVVSQNSLLSSLQDQKETCKVSSCL